MENLISRHFGGQQPINVLAAVDFLLYIMANFDFQVWTESATFWSNNAKCHKMSTFPGVPITFFVGYMWLQSNDKCLAYPGRDPQERIRIQCVAGQSVFPKTQRKPSDTIGLTHRVEQAKKIKLKFFCLLRFCRTKTHPAWVPPTERSKTRRIKPKIGREERSLGGTKSLLEAFVFVVRREVTSTKKTLRHTQQIGYGQPARIDGGKRHN